MRYSKSLLVAKGISGNYTERTCQARGWPFPLLGVTCSSQYCRLFIILLLQLVQCDSNGSDVPDSRNEHTDKVAHVNGFLHVTLYPPVFRVTLGETATGYVNVSLDEVILGEKHWIQVPTGIPAMDNDDDVDGKPTTDGNNGNLKYIDPESKATNLHKMKLNQEGNDISKVQQSNGDSNYLLPKPPATGGETAEPQLYIVTTTNSTKQALPQDKIPQMPSHNEANKNLADTDDRNNLGTNLDKVDKLDPYRPDYSRIISSIGITSCCIDDNIAYLVTSNGDVSVYNASKSFSVTVEGISLGRTSIKFKVKRNTSLSDTQKSRTQGTSTTDSVTTWWLPYEYDVIVTKSANQAPFYMSAVLFAFVSINLIGIGGQLISEEMLSLLKCPLQLSVAMMSRFAVTPAVGLGIIELFKPERNTSLGVLALLCSPAEGASNLLLLLAEGDLTFSATVTSVNNFATVGMLPLWTILFETRIWKVPGKITIPFRESFVIFAYVVIALAIGFYFNRKCSNWYRTFWQWLPSFTIFTLVFTLIVEIYNNHFIFPLVSKEVFCSCLILGMAGYIFGWVVGFLCRLHAQRILVLAIETGAHTTYFTTLLLDNSLDQPEADMAKTAPVLCSMLSLIPAIIIVLLFRFYKRYTGKEFSDLLYNGENDDEMTECLSDKEVVQEKETCV